jgi:hypothetical protein
LAEEEIAYRLGYPDLAMTTKGVSASRHTLRFCGWLALSGAVSLSCVPRLALTADREHENRIDLRDVAVQGDIAMGATSDYQFALVAWHRSADQGTMLEDRDCLNDFLDASRAGFGLMLRQVIEDAIKILCYLGSEFEARH